MVQSIGVPRRAECVVARAHERLERGQLVHHRAHIGGLQLRQLGKNSDGRTFFRAAHALAPVQFGDPVRQLRYTNTEAKQNMREHSKRS